MFANIFSHSEGCLLVLLMVSFAMQKLLSIIRSVCFISVFIFFRRWVKKDFDSIYVKKCSYCVFLSFIVSGLTFRSLIHFEFIFVYGVREFCNFFLLP